MPNNAQKDRKTIYLIFQTDLFLTTVKKKIISGPLLFFPTTTVCIWLVLATTVQLQNALISITNLFVGLPHYFCSS